AAAYELITARSNRVPPAAIRTRELGPSPEERLQLRAAGFAARYLGVPLSDERARQDANLTVEEHFREELESRGIRTRGMNREAVMAAGFQIRGGQHTTSDFSLMMMLD